MLENSALVGVSQVKPGESLDVEAVLGRLGSNSGNMMFTESLNRLLPNSRLISWQISEEEIEGRDAIVFAAANWLATGADFGPLAERIEKTNLPVFLIGVGAQSGLDKKLPNLSAGTLRFLSIIAERSKSFSTRGHFTSEVLERYGFKNSVATGCPSLLLAGSGGYCSEKEASSEKIVLHSTRHRFHKTDALQDYFYREALGMGCDILLQSETPDIMLALGVRIPEDARAEAYAALEQSYGTRADKIELYLREHGKFFSDYQSWIDYMTTRTFCVGTRIHGTIAAILAGTPALLVAHDSRTEELAEAMGVPFCRSSDVDRTAGIDIEAAIGIFDDQRVKVNYDDYKNRFVEYLGSNDLRFSFAATSS